MNLNLTKRKKNCQINNNTYFMFCRVPFSVLSDCESLVVWNLLPKLRQNSFSRLLLKIEQAKFKLSSTPWTNDGQVKLPRNFNLDYAKKKERAQNWKISCFLFLLFVSLLLFFILTLWYDMFTSLPILFFFFQL